MARRPIIDEGLLQRAPKEIRFPFEKLEEAANAALSLEEAVCAVKMKAVANNRGAYYSKLGIKPPPPPTIASFCAARRAMWIEGVIKYYKQEFVKASPRDTAIQNAGSTVDTGIAHEYPLQDALVLQKLAAFAMAEQTNDYEGKDTSGTQIGNQLAGLRGMGFKDEI